MANERIEKRVATTVLRPGDWALTEWRGRFFAVGAVTVSVGGIESGVRQARCCNDGHPTEVGVEACWEGGPSAE